MGAIYLVDEPESFNSTEVKDTLCEAWDLWKNAIDKGKTPREALLLAEQHIEVNSLVNVTNATT